MNTLALSELFGGAARYRALKYVFENPHRHFGARELAAEAKIDPANSSRWLRKWADVGLLEKTVVLNRPRFAASKDPALYYLQLFLQQDSETLALMKARLAELGERVDAAAIFGSVASGTATAGSDVDLLLLTDMSQLEAQIFFKPVARKIGQPINVMTYSRIEWDQAVKTGNPFVLDIRDNAQLPLKGTLDATSPT